MISTNKNILRESRDTATPKKASIDNSWDDTEKYQGYRTSRGSSPFQNKSPAHTASKDLKTLLEEMDCLRLEMEDKIKRSQNSEYFINDHYNVPDIENRIPRNSTKNEINLKDNKCQFKISEIKKQNEEYSRLFSEEIRKHEAEKV